jgi:hypothetical protein
MNRGWLHSKRERNSHFKPTLQRQEPSMGAKPTGPVGRSGSKAQQGLVKRNPSRASVPALLGQAPLSEVAFENVHNKHSAVAGVAVASDGNASPIRQVETQQRRIGALVVCSTSQDRRMEAAAYFSSQQREGACFATRRPLGAQCALMPRQITTCGAHLGSNITCYASTVRFSPLVSPGSTSRCITGCRHADYCAVLGRSSWSVWSQWRGQHSAL